MKSLMTDAHPFRRNLPNRQELLQARRAFRTRCQEVLQQAGIDADTYASQTGDLRGDAAFKLWVEHTRQLLKQAVEEPQPLEKLPRRRRLLTYR
jgi:hypothetical protein